MIARMIAIAGVGFQRMYSIPIVLSLPRKAQNNAKSATVTATPSIGWISIADSSIARQFSVSHLPQTDVMALYEPGTINRGVVGDGKSHCGTVDLPALALQLRLQASAELAVGQLVDQFLKLGLGQPDMVFKEALADLQRIVDHQ